MAKSKKMFQAAHPQCAACGETRQLNVHHIQSPLYVLDAWLFKGAGKPETFHGLADLFLQFLPCSFRTGSRTSTSGRIDRPCVDNRRNAVSNNLIHHCQELDSMDDFNRAGGFSVRLSINGNLQPASRRRNFQRLQVRLHQIKRHLRHGLTVGDRSLSACFLSQFQRIHFSSHDAFCCNSCARKYGSHLAFIDDFGGCRKRRRIIQPENRSGIVKS